MSFPPSFSLQIAAIMDVLAKAAVAEIAKLVEDEAVVLRLEVCRREGEIQELNRSLRKMEAELCRAREAAAKAGKDNQPQGMMGIHGCYADAKSAINDCEEKLEEARTDKDQSILSTTPEVQMKAEPGVVERPETRAVPQQLEGELCSFERDNQTTIPGSDSTHTDGHATGLGSSDYLGFRANALACLTDPPPDDGQAPLCGGSGLLQQSPVSRELLGYSFYRYAYNSMRRRTTKRLPFKRGFPCPYCGKVFNRTAHLERHKMIHTGEKPYHCEICGRRFNQKSSVKEHMKTHRKCVQILPPEMHIADQPQDSKESACNSIGPVVKQSQSEVHDGFAKDEGNLAKVMQVKSEPVEEVVEPAFNAAYLTGSGATREAAQDADGEIRSFERGSEPWLFGLHEQNDPLMSNPENPGVSGQNAPPVPGLRLFIPTRTETLCGSRLPPYSSPGALVEGAASSDLHGMPWHSPSHPWARRNGSSPQALQRPKKCFVCSYCGKIFERGGHLERHLRIHTGEKPYGCHICGRCFNQKSSLKGHMNTHRNGQSFEMLESYHPLGKIHEGQPSVGLETPESGRSTLEKQLSGSVFNGVLGEQTIIVKVETVDNFQLPEQS